MLKDQAARTPHPQWVRVVGGWTEFQFAEKRMPTLEELNAAAPDTPVFVLHLYDRALLNRAALQAVGYTKDTPNPPGGEIVRDASGNPTGMLIARPNAMILYATLAKGPTAAGIPGQLDPPVHARTEPPGRDQRHRCRRRFPELPGRLPDHQQAGRRRTADHPHRLQPVHPEQGAELADFQKWTGMVKPGDGDDFLRHNGAGEMLVFSAADFEDFLEPRPDLAEGMEDELERVVRHLVSNRWPFRLHATYDESISRMLDVFEKVNRDIPSMACTGSSTTPRPSPRATSSASRRWAAASPSSTAWPSRANTSSTATVPRRPSHPPVKMLEMGVPVGAGTDATRVASYNPWTALYWLVSGRTGRHQAVWHRRPPAARDRAGTVDRRQRLVLQRTGQEGPIQAGQLADLAVLSADFFSVHEDEIKASNRC
jgi:predicted amidohydrolase YtcJ